MGGHCSGQELVWVDRLVFAGEMEDSDSRRSVRGRRHKGGSMLEFRSS